MNRFQKVIVFLAVMVGSFGVYQIVHAFSVERYVNTAGTQIYDLDDSGNQTVVGNQTVAGTQAITGATTQTGASTFTGAATFNGAVIVPSTFTQSGYAAAMSTTTFSGGVGLWARSLVNINTLIASTTNQLVVCSDCLQSKVCISTNSITAGAFVVLQATAPGAGALQHCQ